LKAALYSAFHHAQPLSPSSFFSFRRSPGGHCRPALPRHCNRQPLKATSTLSEIIYTMRLFSSLFASFLFAATCHAQTGTVLPPNAIVEGKSQAEWSRAWWQWAGSFDRDNSPVGDRTGDKCHLKQNGSVWFLAGTYGSHRTVRTCTIPQGRAVFFPLINYVVMPSGTGSLTCEIATGAARTMTDEPSSLVLEINGVRVPNLERHRQASPECFDLAAQANSPARVFPSAANGYYVMLAPLAPGRYVLNFGGVLPRLAQALTYTLVVE